MIREAGLFSCKGVSFRPDQIPSRNLAMGWSFLEATDPNSCSRRRVLHPGLRRGDRADDSAAGSRCVPACLRGLGQHLELGWNQLDRASPHEPAANLGLHTLAFDAAHGNLITTTGAQQGATGSQTWIWADGNWKRVA